MTTYRTPYAARCEDHAESLYWQDADRDAAIAEAVDQEYERLAGDGEDRPLTAHIEVLTDAEWCPTPEGMEDCPRGCDHAGPGWGDPDRDMLLDYASREVVQVHAYTAAEMAAHLRGRDDLLEVLRLAGALPRLP